MSVPGRRLLVHAPALVSLLVIAGLCILPAWAATGWVDHDYPSPVPLIDQPLPFSGSGVPAGAAISVHEIDTTGGYDPGAPDAPLTGDDLCAGVTADDDGSWDCAAHAMFFAPGRHVFRVVVEPPGRPAEWDDVTLTIGPSALALRTKQLEPGTNIVTITGVRDVGERFRVFAAVEDQAPETSFAPMALTVADCSSDPLPGNQFSCTADLADDLPVGTVVKVSLGEQVVTDSGDHDLSDLQLVELVVGAPSGAVDPPSAGSAGSIGEPPSPGVAAPGAGSGSTPPSLGTEAGDGPSGGGEPTQTSETGSDGSDDSPSADPLDDPLHVLVLGAVAFAVWSMFGTLGLARGSDPQRRRDRSLLSFGESAPDGGGGGVLALGLAVVLGTSSSKESVSHARRYGQRWGDRSPTWHLRGWQRIDRLSKHLPVTVSRRFSLVARIGTDANYLRAAFGSAWLVLPFAGLVLGVLAAADSAWLPTAPSTWLTGVLIALAAVDAAAGAAAVVGFSAAVLIAGGLTFGGVGFLDGLRGLLGLTVLWFVVPLVGAGARPFRRLVEPGRRYGWDRWGDALIAALASGLAVFAASAGLEDLTGRASEASHHAGTLALMAAGLVALRIGAEEVVADGYPSRLRAVQPLRPLASPARPHRLRATVIGGLLVLVFAHGVIGSCWQLWVGTAMCIVPGVVAAFDDRLPNFVEVHRRLPRGVIRLSLVLVVGLLFAHLLADALHDQPTRAVRDGFVVLAFLPFVLRCLDIVGRHSPAPPWTWPRQLAGAGIVAATIWVAFTML